MVVFWFVIILLVASFICGIVFKDFIIKLCNKIFGVFNKVQKDVVDGTTKIVDDVNKDIKGE
jgi:hypothetical protein